MAKLIDHLWQVVEDGRSDFIHFTLSYLTLTAARNRIITNYSKAGLRSGKADRYLDSLSDGSIATRESL